ncbi:MAG: hypothetical protein COA43_02585 [Robiginitomaculum sp.]|nr:MAG: hypothetical protein COA43_02585 [Robiginitomaculum sp.]
MTRPLPPLNSIRAFEVAARHMNFSRAAEELGVTQGAISKQVIALEDYIGIKLFERLPGGLRLTVQGMTLRDQVHPVFETLGDTFSQFSRRPPRSHICRISTLSSFATQFLVPRLRKFEQELPHIDLEILTSVRLVDLSREEVDLSIRFGNGTWEDVVASPLIPGKLIPVCSPDFYEKSKCKDVNTFVNSARRVQAFTRNEWLNWAQEAGVELTNSVKIYIMEDFFVAMKTVMEGHCIGLLPAVLARPHIREGRLRTFSDISIIEEGTYHIVHRANAERRPIVRDVIAWLRKEVENDLTF